MHHAWDDYLERSVAPFVLIRDHVLLPLAEKLADIDSALTARLTRPVIDAIVEQIPAAWLSGDAPFADHRDHRAAYATWLERRLQAPRAFVEEAIRARSRNL